MLTFGAVDSRETSSIAVTLVIGRLEAAHAVAGVTTWEAAATVLCKRLLRNNSPESFSSLPHLLCLPPCAAAQGK